MPSGLMCGTAQPWERNHYRVFSKTENLSGQTLHLD
jgi:hypothetical protein